MLETYHTTRVISKRHTARVHEPKVRVTKALFPKTSGLLPGFGHVTQNYIDYPASGQVPLRLAHLIQVGCAFSSRFSSCFLRIFAIVACDMILHVDVAGIGAWCRCFIFIFDVLFFVLFRLVCGMKKRSVYRSPLAGILNIRSNFSLNLRREEVALYRRRAARRLCREYIDANDSSTWRSAVDCYLRP